MTTTNSLVGSQANDRVGRYGLTPLSNGNYVVISPFWANGAAAQAGAAAWCSGTLGCTGVVTTTNSRVGSQANDQVGNSGGVSALRNGNYVVNSGYWAHSALALSGAVTWGDGAMGITGAVTTINSVLRRVAAGGTSLNLVFDYLNDQLVVGRPAENLVTFFELPRRVYLPLVRR